MNGQVGYTSPRSKYFKSWRDYSSAMMNIKMDDWPQMKDSMSINEKTEWLLNNIKKSAGSFIKIKKRKSPDDFFDAELEDMRNVKNKLYKLAQFAVNENEETRDQMWNDYKLYRVVYKKTIMEKKFANNQRRLDKVENDMKGTWRVLNSILCNQQDDIEYIEDNGHRYERDIEIANRLNEFFVQSVIDLNNDIPARPFECYVGNRGNVKFVFKGVSITEMKRHLNELKNGSDEFNVNKNVLTDVIEKEGIAVANMNR